MLINVSTLLQEPVGHARRYAVNHEPVAVPEARFAQEITGDLRLIRSERGVLVTAELELAPVSVQCGRCLEMFETPVSVQFDEEFVLDHDPITGRRVEVLPDDFRIDTRRHLDLSEAVRQYEESALPIRPLCRPDCRGLCPRCGHNLNTGPCACAPADSDDRWSALARLQERLGTEDGDGAPEA
ncbi:MAG: DUF177 domain-containing protein [Dehalococcoidia bacterium]